MSTRANIIIKDRHTTLYFYRHSDGYPEATGVDLQKFIEGYSKHLRLDAMQSAGWLIIHGAKANYAADKGYELTKVINTIAIPSKKEVL